MELHHAPLRLLLSSVQFSASHGLLACHFWAEGGELQGLALPPFCSVACNLQCARFIIRWNGLGIQGQTDGGQNEAEEKIQSSPSPSPSPDCTISRGSIAMARLCCCACSERRSWSTPAFSFSSSPLRGSWLQIGMAGWLAGWMDAATAAAGARQIRLVVGTSDSAVQMPANGTPQFGHAPGSLMFSACRGLPPALERLVELREHANAHANGEGDLCAVIQTTA